MRLFAACVALLTGCAPLVVGAGRTLPPALQYDPADFAGKPAERNVKPPERLVLPNGLEVFWAHDGSAVAFVDMALLVGCGRVDEPPALAGLTRFLFSSAMAGGGAEVPATEASRIVTDLDVSPSIDDGDSYWWVRVPLDRVEEVSRLMRGAVMRPVFDASAVERLRRNTLDALADPDVRGAELGAALHRRTINGNLPGLAAPRTQATVAAIDGPALRAHAERCFTPGNAKLMLTGALDEATVRALTAPWAEWKGSLQPRRVSPPTPPRPRRLTLQPVVGDSTVTVTLLGPGLPPGTTERAAGDVLMGLLESDVTWELRQGFGHVYDVQSAMEVGPGSGAAFLQFTTRREVAHEAVRRTSQILQRWWARWPIDRENLERVQKSWLRFHARQSVSSRTFAAARRSLVDGHADELTWSQQLERLRPGDLSSLFATSFRPEHLQVLVVGDVDLAADWKSLGEVETLPTLRP